MSDVSPEPIDPLEEFLRDLPPIEEINLDGDLSSQETISEPPIDDRPFEDATTHIGDGVCIVCGAPTFRPPGLTKSGRRKRVPRYCDLHTPSRNTATAYEPLSGAALESQLQKIQDELADDLRLLGMLCGPMFPVTGYYMVDHADPFTIAVLKLAKNNTRILRALHRVAQVAPVYTMAETIAGVAYSVQVDTHKADPHTTVAQRLGVARAYDSVYPQEGTPTAMSTNGYVPPPRYATVQ